MLSKIKFKRLKIGYISKAGKNNTGKIVSKKKSLINSKSVFKIDYFRR